MSRRMVAGFAGLVVAVALVGAASAQITSPFTAYGTGVAANATVEASIDGVSCGSTQADALGQWVLSIAPDAPCGPSNDDTIRFRVNGQTAAETATFLYGGAPTDIANGITLTVTGGTPGGSTAEGGVFLTPLTTGVNLAVFSGGTVDDAVAAAEDAVSISATVDGELVVYVVGAPAFVNASFNAAFPGGVIPTNTPLVVVID